jgi:hypothetical protein
MIDGLVIAGHVTIERSIPADAAANVSLNRFTEVRKNVVNDVLVRIGHGFPLRVARLSRRREIGRARVPGIKPRIKRSR